MQFSFRHVILILGVVLFFSSFLFWGRQQYSYIIILLIGACITFFAFLVVLFKDDVKSKIKWTALIAAVIILQPYIGAFFVNCSFRILLGTHRKLFDEVNRILISKPTEIYYWNKASVDTTTLFSQPEKSKVRTFFERTGVAYMSKNDVHVYYETFGMLDARIGVYYFYNGFIPAKPFTKIEGSWYY